MKGIAIIGLSSFGYYLAMNLSDAGIEVIAVDMEEEKIDKIKNSIHKAVIADATDRDTLESLGLEDLDGVVVSLGEIESSVLVTLHLKELKIKNIITKALSEEHGKILDMIGATEVIFPEKDMSFKVARRLTHENILEYVPLAEGYSIVDLAPPQSIVGKTLGELDLTNEYNVQVIVVKELIPEKITMIPRADYKVKSSDILVVMGEDKNILKVQSLK
ncbi:MAG: TrkA family potassium uptake protein [bacterium]